MPESAAAGSRASWSERKVGLVRAWRVGVLAILGLGGIYDGVFTANEAAALGTILSFLFCLHRRKLTWRAFFGHLRVAALNTAVIYTLIFLISRAI